MMTDALANRGCRSAPSSWLRQLAAARWTVLFFLTTAAAALAVALGEQSATVWMVIPFSLLVLNLAAAIATLPRFRRDLPLLLFHLALLLMVALFIWARLTYLYAATTLTNGSQFEGHLLNDARGPLHGNPLASLRFSNEGFTQNYSKLRPGDSQFSLTYNRVNWRDENGQWRTAEIGDDQPLVVGHYRVYTTSRQGFSPSFYWQPNAGAGEVGSVQLNGISEETFAPVNDWALPDGTEVWAMLDIHDIQQIESDNTNLGARTLAHRLVLRIDEERYNLTPGESIQLKGGTLTYLKLNSWMGYRIVYDPAQPWLIATIFVGISCLFWFYLRKLFGKGSWDSDR